MKSISLLLLTCLSFLSVQAQWKWQDPLKAGFPTIQNQGWAGEIGNTYTRLPQRAESTVRKPVWDLSRNSAGLAVHFYSDGPEIRVRYTVSGGMSMPHMPATGVSGLDLYSVNSDGQWRILFGGNPYGDTIQYHYTNIGKDKYHDRGFEYRLYLPLYNSVTWMEIGVPEGSQLTFIPASPAKPILLYGTSIAQGACASRPAMAWANILGRAVGFPLVNLGFSGNGRLEKEMLDLINEIDARLYILDCLPNLTDKTEAEIELLVLDAVRQLRTSHSTPILLVEHAGYSNALMDSDKLEEYTHTNRASHKAYEKLIQEGVKDLFYLTHDELAFPMDAWVDYVHPSDLGMRIQASAVEKKVREILYLPQGATTITQPVTQRREPHIYEWQTRHQDILAFNKKNPPTSVMIGNSITHFWGGEPTGPSQNGQDTWEAVMRPAGFHNLGYGWDKIENALWRVYHDELDGYDAKQVVLAIGTNNLAFNKDGEIVEGLRFLLTAIRERQPQAKIKVIGLLPRREMEGRVKYLNRLIREMALSEKVLYLDPGVNLLEKNGKIEESLFLDGLHPNEKGYRKIVNEIAGLDE